VFRQCKRITFPEDETFDIGQDTRTGVAMLDYRYDVQFKFTGKIDKLTFKLEPFKPEQSAEAGAPDRPRAGVAPSAVGEAKHAENR